MPTIASLIVRIGAQDQEIQHALASVGQKAKSVDADLKRLGGTTLGAKAEASLKDLKSTMDSITKAQERVAEKARLAAAGLEAMGGVARLTEKELKQVQRTLNEGVSAYEALGKKAPAELQKVADAVKGKLDAPMGQLNTKMVAIGTALGNVLGNAAVQVGRAMLDSAKATLDYADALSNLSAKTGITVEGLQRIEALGVTSGVSMETLAGSVSMLQRKLDDPAALKALKEMGLNYEQIRNMKPEDQFLEIAKSVAAIEDPVERANAGAAVFGKQWDAIAPAIQGDIDAIVSSVNGMSAEQVAAWDRLGDAIDRWQKRASQAFAQFGADAILAAEQTETTWLSILTTSALWDYAEKLDEIKSNITNLPTPKKGPAFTFAPYDPAQKTQGTDLNRILAESDEKVTGLIKKSEDLAKARAEAFAQKLFDRDAITNAEGLVTALGGVENLSKLTATATKQLHEELGRAREVYAAMGREVPAALEDIYLRTIPVRTFMQTLAKAPTIGMQKPFVTFGETLAAGTVYARDYSYALTAGMITVDKFGNVIQSEGIPRVKSLNVELGKTKGVAEDMRDGIGKAFGAIPDLLKSAFTGGGGLLGAAKAFGVQLAEAMLAPLMARWSATLAKLGGALSGAVGLGTTAVHAGTSAATQTATTAAVAGGTAAATTAATATPAVAAPAAGAGAFGFGLTASQAIPIYGAVAAGVYGVYRGIKALKEQKVQKEINDQRDAFFKMAGSLEDLNPRVQYLTGNLSAVQAVFDARTPQAFADATANLNAILEDGRAKFAAIEEGIGTATGKLSGLLELTPEVQSALDQVFNAKRPEEYLDAVGRLNKALDEQATKGQTLKGTIQEYGIKFQDAGKGFQQGNINERAQKLTKDFQVLRQSGMDINVQMGYMSKNINDFVRDAKKAGVEVPESMRAVIQTAIDAGEVYDENGKKITDIKDLGLTFGTTMETTMKTVGGAVDKLTLVLGDLATFLKDRMPAAAKEGAAETNAELGKIEDPVVTVRYRDGGPPAPDFPEAPGAAIGARVRPWGLQHLASGGLARGTDTVPAMLTPGELVLNKDQQRALFGGSAPVVVNLSIAIDGVFSEGDLVQTVQRRVAPILAQTIEDNVAGSRTRFQDVLGVP